MSKRLKEINDNEIRIISASEPTLRRSNKRLVRLCLLIAAIILLSGAAFLLFRPEDHDEIESQALPEQEYATENTPIRLQDEQISKVKAFTSVRDTMIDRKGLLILTPENARPRLIIGIESLNDSNIVLAAQAADVRGDNGQIAGTYVLNGDLISKGEAKAGYCSIINGDLSIGIANATPMLEETLTEGGYFFRQYPLVVGGQIVENKPKGKSIRKALAEIGGKICMIISRQRLTYHDFSQLLIDAGVKNAIYLVGSSSSYGFYVTETGEKIRFTSKEPLSEYENLNFIVWEQE